MSAGNFAATTSVSVSKSRDEIERTLQRYGAEQFAYGWQQEQAGIGFVVAGRQIRFLLPLPDRADRAFTRTEQGRARSRAATEAAYEQAVRSRWRQLLLVIKAKLQAVESGIVTFEQEFAMHFVLPGGDTVEERVLPAIDEAYKTGQVPPLLGPVTSRPIALEAS